MHNGPDQTFASPSAKQRVTPDRQTPWNVAVAQQAGQRRPSAAIARGQSLKCSILQVRTAGARGTFLPLPRSRRHRVSQRQAGQHIPSSAAGAALDSLAYTSAGRKRASEMEHTTLHTRRNDRPASRSASHLPTKGSGQEPPWVAVPPIDGRDSCVPNHGLCIGS